MVSTSVKRAGRSHLNVRLLRGMVASPDLRAKYPLQGNRALTVRGSGVSAVKVGTAAPGRCVWVPSYGSEEM